MIDAIKAVRKQAADERAELHATGEPLTDYGSGFLDGLDKAWIAAVNALRDPDDFDEQTDDLIENALWEQAVADGEDWALVDRCGCRSAVVTAGVCVLCGRSYPVGGAV